MVANRGRIARAVVALAICSVAIGPVLAAVPKHPIRAKSSIKFSSGIGSFTPAAADARRAMSFGQVGFADSGFRFTPSIAPGSRRNVTVAIRARAFNPGRAGLVSGQGPALSAITPSAYNLGVAIGWKRFALTGDVARIEGSLLPLDREAADVGVSYLGNKWSTRLQLGAERAIGTSSRLVSADESYSVDLGGSYSLTHNLEVTGGVRYKMQRDRMARLTDDRQDSQAVYVGTAFRF